MATRFVNFSVLVVCTVFIQSCNLKEPMLTTKKIYITSESGYKMSEQENVRFSKGKDNTSGTVINVDVNTLKQTIDGIGSSFTESSAFVLAHLEPSRRMEVMDAIFGENGANFSLARTHIGSCDFSVTGKYSYADYPGDKKLESFSLKPDVEGFSRTEYPGIKDEDYDLLPMIKEALEIKKNQNDKDLRIVASAWTAPSWMKDINAWYIPGTPENNYQGTGGSLMKEYEETYADYLIKYLNASRAEGVEIWAITPVNEPHGNNGQWESMHFTPETQNAFIKNYLGPKLQNGDNSNVRLLIYDQNRDGLEHWQTSSSAMPKQQPMFTVLLSTGMKARSRFMRRFLTGLRESSPIML